MTIAENNKQLVDGIREHGISALLGRQYWPIQSRLHELRYYYSNGKDRYMIYADCYGLFRLALVDNDKRIVRVIAHGGADRLHGLYVNCICRSFLTAPCTNSCY